MMGRKAKEEKEARRIEEIREARRERLECDESQMDELVERIEKLKAGPGPLPSQPLYQSVAANSSPGFQILTVSSGGTVASNGVIVGGNVSMPLVNSNGDPYVTLCDADIEKIAQRVCKILMLPQDWQKALEWLSSEEA